MRILRLFLFCTVAFFGACAEKDFAKATVDRHAAAIEEFQKAQLRFKTAVAGVRSEVGYDQAAPELDRIVEDFRRVAVLMRDLDAPEETARAGYRQLISAGHGKAEPTGEDMMGMLAIGSRSKVITAWMEAFTAAGQEVGVEMARLYGKIDHGAAE